MRSTDLTGKVSYLRGLGLAALSCGLLAACATTEEQAVANPDHLTVTIADGNLTGSYNPASFDEEVVRQALAGNCAGGKVATYEEAAGEDGLTAFTATCVDGTTPESGTFTYQRAATRPATTEEAAAAQAAIASPTGTATTGTTTATALAPAGM